ncbi:MAG: c-type cytochrome [Hyphomicrobium sp.]|jgi:mono/diheme cytochrome c family protein
MSVRTLALIVLMLLSLPLRPAQADDVEKGEQLARALCAQCHLNPGQGEKKGPMGVPGFAAVANRPLQTFEGVVGWLQSAPPMMPRHRLTQDEMYALAAYIMSLRKER